MDLKLIEFRSIFERVNAQSMHEIEHLMRESSDFEYCYKHFLACQGKSVRSIRLFLFVVCLISIHTVLRFVPSKIRAQFDTVCRWS